MDWFPEKDCTSKCHSVIHAKLIQSCVCVATSSQLRAYAVWLCHNFATITDEFGRTLLHTASSCGKYQTVEWLLKQCKADVDTKDRESGWTALHRSFYYGQLSSARVLLMNGASLRATDHDGLSPLDVILKDRLPYIEYLLSDPSEVYVWGSNFNYNLGLGNSSSRSVPEILEIFRKDFIYIKQVQICKFHSVFLSMNGKVYTCGYGHGGRLGQETENISLVPSLVKGLGSQICKQAMAGQDHLILLLQNGQVWTCGLNIYHQLGHIPFNEKVLVPKPISLKFLKGNEVVGVRAARYHSVIYTKNCIYTFGLNAGQLGHPKGERTQMTPRQVSGLNVENYKLTHVEVSDGATVCATSRGDIYVFHEYLVRKIASRQLEIQKLSIVGGHLDSQVDAVGIREGGGLELRVALLANSGKVYLWRQSDPYLRRCLFTMHKEILVSDLHINHHSIGLITAKNEGYLGFIVPFKGKRTAPPTSTIRAPSNFSSKSCLGLVTLLETDDCHFIKVKRLPNVYRATFITSDSKGRNFAVLQSDPKMGLVEVPWVSNSKMTEDFVKLLSETHVQDDFHDIIIKVENSEFAAHKYILASRCEYFKKQFSKEIFKNEYLIIDDTKSEVFEQVLKFIYTNSCDFLVDGFEIKIQVNAETEKKKKHSSKTPSQILILQELSRRFGINYLSERLERIKLVQNKILCSDTNLPPNMKFKRNLFPLLNDVNLVSSDGVIFKCHKCILIARLDYFHSMLSTYWAENEQLEQLQLPIPSKVLESIIDYLYTDKCSIVTNSNDVQFLSETLMYSDQLMILILKEMCEVSLVRLITLKNSGELLELSSVYNALQLKKSCMHYICINLAAVIELKVLEVLSKDVMEDLSIYYRTMAPGFQNRKLVSSNAPSQKDLILLEEKFPVDNISSFEKSKSESHENKIRNRIRCSSSNSDVKDCSFSEKEARFEKNEDVILNVLNADDDIKKLDELICYSPKEKEVEYLKSPFKSRNEENGLWNLTCFPKCNEAVNLSEIMQEENKLADLGKKTNAPKLKPIPHISQKQKKKSSQSKTVTSPSSPPKQTRCPWEKLTEQSSPSFWDSFSKKDFTSSSLKRTSSTSPNSVKTVRKLSQDYYPEKAQDIVISLQDIQIAEEEKLHKINSLKFKSLHLINIEDQAIEELTLLYKINDNHKEKVTVSRIELQKIASPVWKRKH